MNLDWERLSMSGYLEALEVHNEPPEERKKGSPDIDRLRAFVRAHNDE